jgi:hypothetical protein
MLINNNVLLRLAADSSYTWMRSLAPLRGALKTAPKGCCGRKRRLDIPPSVYDQIGSSAVFREELKGLKLRFGTQLNVAVGSHRFTVV